MNYNKIRKMDISNGPGVRVSLFVQGCTFNCDECFNPETHDFNKGKEFTGDTIRRIIELCKSDTIKGLSILGGEPLHPKNRETVVDIMRVFKYYYPEKTIWCWTGFTLEQLLSQNDEDIKSMLIYLDVLVDGQFKKELKDIRLKYCGSTNQRVIDIQESMKQNHLVYYNG